MSYNQAMNHWRNHRKDKFYQQCSGYSGKGNNHEQCDSDKEKCEMEYKEKCKKKMIEQGKIMQYPVYIKYDCFNGLVFCDKRAIGGTEINSDDELVRAVKNAA